MALGKVLPMDYREEKQPAVGPEESRWVLEQLQVLAEEEVESKERLHQVEMQALEQLFEVVSKY